MGSVYERVVKGKFFPADAPRAVPQAVDHKARGGAGAEVLYSLAFRAGAAVDGFCL